MNNTKSSARRGLFTACCLFLALLLFAAVSFLPGKARAATVVDSGACGDNLKWTLDSDGLLTISGSGQMTDYNSFFLFGIHYSFAPWSGSVDNGNRIKMVVIKNDVTSIGDSAFSGCTGLTNVTIPNSVTSIGDSAFSGCTGLTSVTIPNSVTSIGDNPFKNCSSLNKINVVAGNTVYHSAGNCIIETKSKTLIAGCKNSVIPADGSVTSIGYEAFSVCTGLTSVTIPNSVTSIGNYAFYNSTDLKSVTIPNSVTSIGWAAFSGCTGLTSVTIPNSVTSIGDQTFYGCTGMTSMTIPSSVTSIGDSAFYNCTGLTSVTIPNSVTSIGRHAFFGCSSLNKINVVAGNTVYHSAGNCIIETKSKTLIAGCKNSVIPADGSVTSIGDDAFYDCIGLTSVTIPNSVTSIGRHAFHGCTGLTSVTIPNSVTSIGWAAFSGCTGLTSVTIPNSVTSIGEDAFSGCTGLTSVTIPNSVTSIESSAFFRCAWLTSVTIPDSVTSIGRRAFDGCSRLKDIYYNGTEAQWKKIKIADNNEELKKAVIHYTNYTVYTVTYNANGGIGVPATQTKKKGAALTLSSVKPTKQYQLTYVPNDGQLSETGKTVAVVFDVWNTKADGSGVAYASGAFYQADENVTLYAQWMNPKAGNLPNPTRSGYAFAGWFTAASGGTQITKDSVITKSQTLYAHWTAIPKNAYVITYNANGGTGTPASQTKTEGKALALSTAKPTKQYQLTYVPNGGQLSETGKTVAVVFDVWNTKADGSGVVYASGAFYQADENVTLYAQWMNPKAGNLPNPTRSGYAFAGWFTAASGGTQITKDSVITKSQTLYAHWTAIPKNAYVITYNANGGTGTPASQTKTEGKAFALSTAKPSKTYLLSYNAAGGKVSPASKSVSVPFKNWNTKIDGTGTAYAPGGTYSKDASATLYAQWSNPKAGALAAPTRSGYTFAGWYTAASGGTKITSDSVITKSQTLYAHWTAAPEKNLYDLGEETYSFENYGDSDSPFGHCFGMSMTSAGYYMGNLDVGDIGLSSCQKLYTMTLTPKVKAPICLYQSIQGHYQVDAIVAGGKFYSNGYKWNYNVAEDWNAVLAYVKNHAYDHKGSLQVGIRNEEGGHAVNFLRYAKVDGQDRIYVYDNNFPNHESYLYLTEQGVMEAPVATFGKPVRCILLRDVATYFELAKSYDASRVLYGAKDQLTVEGATFSYMEGSVDGTEYVMYELPADTRKVTIKPLADNADFIYMDVEYSFGEITDETYGVFRLADMREGAVVQEAQFTIYNGSGTSPSLPGDVSGDGEVTAEDARLALRAAVGLETYAAGSAEFLAADASHDGEITSEDARLILRAAVGLETLS